MDDNYEFYCLSFNNKERKESMTARFDKIGISCNFYEGVTVEDNRIANKKLDFGTKCCWSCAYGHLDMINNFYHNSNKEFGIFCEDDLLIHKDLKSFMPKIITDFKELKLDVLLLGYLIPFKINEDIPGFELKSTSYTNSIDTKYKYHNFPNDVWGTQMYMLSKKQAGVLLDKYYTDYADKTLSNPNMTPFSADWTLTKDENRGVIFPMFATEDNLKFYEHSGQHNFHKMCFDVNFDKDTFI
jgi:hypothetical protein